MHSHTWILEHLSDDDLRFLVRALVTRRDDHEHVVEVLRDKPDLVDIMLEDPALFERLWGDAEALNTVSPYLFFSAALRQVRREMRGSSPTFEFDEDDSRYPVFDGAEVRAFLSDPARRHYLVELLVSFTRGYSQGQGGSPEKRTMKWRFGHLDLAALERLQTIVEPADRFAVDRRIGDLSLFMAGACVSSEAKPLIQELARQVGIPLEGSSLRESVEALEEHGRRAYLRVSQHPIAIRTGQSALFQVLANEIHLARKALNHLHLHYMPPLPGLAAPLMGTG
ncbi:MAG: hypothetical protein KM310_07800 [Clostridiales bacterium]|nr:hypothetical protein [Clostridiales bacterium]